MGHKANEFGVRLLIRFSFAFHPRLRMGVRRCARRHGADRSSPRSMLASHEIVAKADADDASTRMSHSASFDKVLRRYTSDWAGLGVVEISHHGWIRVGEERRSGSWSRLDEDRQIGDIAVNAAS
jgi:alkanesulfonate monooxygenase SsuD/methylene tetrahydromethanopterin reductase-like flavin-dependent oxidoreductase (luciferase family)